MEIDSQGIKIGLQRLGRDCRCTMPGMALLQSLPAMVDVSLHSYSDLLDLTQLAGVTDARGQRST
eukprot:7870-Amphidinium_carterae.1